MTALPVLLAGALALAAGPAQAQKAKDTLRIAFTDPISTTNDFFDPKPEAAGAQRAIYSTLLVFDPATRSFKPDLAASWRRVSPTVLEFKLRKGVKFHDGSPLTADDVVYTINWLLDPATKLRFGYVYTQRFVRAEKVDDETVRVEEKASIADDLAAIATTLTIFPKHVFEKFADKSDFARQQPIGTGPYKVVSFSPDKGIVLEKWDGYVAPGPWNPAGTIGRIEILPIHDLQTQTAQLMTGGLDIIHDMPRDQAHQVAANPNFAMTTSAGLDLFYMNIDAAGRSGNKALTDVRVRRAIAMAIDREALVKNVSPAGATVPNAPCVPVMTGCKVGSAPPAHDPVAAKKLLAEAGYPDGFEVSIVSNPGGEQMSEAVAGELRKIGILGKVEHLTFAGYRSRQVAGKLEILIGIWDAAGRPDVAGTVGYFWGGSNLDYARDETIQKLGAEAAVQRDPEKRDAVYREIFDRNNDQVFILPLTTFPTVFVHSKDVAMENTTIGALAMDFNRVHWK